MNKLLLVAICVGLAITLLSCGNQKTSQGESREAKALLQGTWMDNETEDVLFQMKGDTVYFSDSTSTLCISAVTATISRNRLTTYYVSRTRTAKY